MIESGQMTAMNTKEFNEIDKSNLKPDATPPSPKKIIDKLNKLSEMRDAIDILRTRYETRREEILLTIKPMLDALEAEWSPLIDKTQEEITIFEKEIKEDVLLNGSSVKSSRYRAIYFRGRTTWDTKGISKYAEINPEILKFRKQGQPFITINTIKNKNNSSINSLTPETSKDPEQKINVYVLKKDDKYEI